MISEKDLRQNIAMSMAMCDSLRTNNFKVNQAVMRAAQQVLRGCYPELGALLSE